MIYLPSNKKQFYFEDMTMSSHGGKNNENTRRLRE